MPSDRTQLLAVTDITVAFVTVQLVNVEVLITEFADAVTFLNMLPVPVTFVKVVPFSELLFMIVPLMLFGAIKVLPSRILTAV
jgi:hypothetical protein